MLKKRWIALAGVSVAATSFVAWAATAYQVQTKLSTAGGTIKVREKALQTAAGSVVYSNFTTSAPVPVTVSADIANGYTISSITKGGVTTTNPGNSWSGSFVKSGGTIQSLTASFARAKYGVTATVSGDGTVSPSGTTNVTWGGSLNMTATPKFTTGYVKSVKDGNGNDIVTAGLPAAGAFPFTLSNIKAPVAVNVVFETASVSAGGDKVSPVGAATTIYGSATGSGTVAWSYTGPGDATLTPNLDNPAHPTFTPSIAGTYTLTMTETVGDKVVATSTMQVTAVSSVTDAMRVQCNSCHSASGMAPSSAFANWSVSQHQSHINCVSCHTDGPMPTPVNTATVNPTNLVVLNSTAGTPGTIYCTKCHSSQGSNFTSSLHWTSATGNGDDAYFVAAGHGSVASCAQKCHFNQGAVQGCGVCHSGGLNSDGTLVAADSAHKPLRATGDIDTCFACHSGAKHGGPTTAFQLSAHWNNATQYRYTSVQHGVAGYCANNCHFKPDPASGNLKVGCSACHDSHKPESIVASAICQTCHTGSHHDATLTQPNHLVVPDCTACHNYHTLQTGLPHTNYTSSITNPSYRASYVTPRTTCVTCHSAAGVDDSTTVKLRREEWASSGHGDINAAPWKASTSHDWKNANACVRCHTAAGFVTYTDSNFTVATPMGATDKESEPLTCNACHTDNTFATRTVAAFPAFYNYTVAGQGGGSYSYNYPDVGTSNLCIPCHSNRQAGQNLKNLAAKATAAYWTNVSFMNPHYNGGAATLYGVTGYKFLADSMYQGARSHQEVGAGANGPCVGCHMDGKNHTFGVENLTSCVACHGDTGMTQTVLDEKKAAFNSLKLALQAQLSSAKGIKYNPAVYGYFFQDKAGTKSFKNWGNADTMGVALNLHLVDHDPGAFAHNPTYVKQLLRDSIDFVANGAVDRSRDLSATINALAGVSDADKAAAVSAIADAQMGNLVACNSCHSTQVAAVQSGKHAGEATGHGSANCGRCHSTEGYESYVAAVAAGSATFDGVGTGYTGTTNVSCEACHDQHGQVRTVTNWDPKISADAAAASDQFKLCTSCHNLVNASGTPIGSGLVVSGQTTASMQQHNKDWYRNIASTHYDLTTTGVGMSSTVVEGYNVRYNKDSACTDCHGHEFYTNTNGAVANPPTEATIHTEWASSGHAGKALLAKFGAFTTAGNHARSRTQANNAAVMAAGITGTTGAAWEHYSWDDSTGTSSDRKGCQKCHTATGASNYLNAPATYDPANNDFSHLAQWATAKNSPQNESLYCWGCHKNAGTGELRNPGAITADYNFKGVKAVMPDASASNVCFACHSGRESGESITALTAAGNTFTNVSFVNSHYMAAAGLMYGKVAYTNFVPANTPIGTSTYGASVTIPEDGGALTSTHRKLGTSAIVGDHGVTAEMGINVNGPCAACHYANGNHELEIGAVAFQKVCVNCHTSEGGTPLTVDNFKELFIEEQAVPFNDALALALAKLDANYNIRYDGSAHPYFYDKNLEAAGKTGSAAAVKDWTRGGALTAAQAENLMGACFNINLLKRDPAAYVHARTLARRVLYDTIDFLDDNTINLSTGATAIAYDPVKYVKGANASEATESFKYLAGYDRKTNVWNAVERP